MPSRWFRQNVSDAAEMTADQAMQSISVIARADVRRLFGPDGQLLPMRLWPDDMAICVTSIRHRPSGWTSSFTTSSRFLKQSRPRAVESVQGMSAIAVFDHAAYLGAEPPPEDGH